MSKDMWWYVYNDPDRTAELVQARQGLGTVPITIDPALTPGTCELHRPDGTITPFFKQDTAS